MPETRDLLAEVKRLRQDQEDQGELIQALLRHSGRQVKEEMLARLSSDEVAADILMLVDGVRSQGEILAELRRANPPGPSPMTVSRRFRLLSEELHLIALVAKTGTGNVYRRTIVDKTLGISRALQRAARA